MTVVSSFEERGRTIGQGAMTLRSLTGTLAVLPKEGASRVVLGAVFVLAGLNHFWHPRLYRAIMPPYLPAHGGLVALSGVAEVLFGVLVLLPRWRCLARWGLIATLVAVFPANLHMALHADRYGRFPAWLLWCRLPLQLILVAWVYRSTKAPRGGKEDSC